jgi:hypothetical protein
MTEKFLSFKFDQNVYCAQAWGCWLYVQIGSWAWFLGSRCHYSLRIEWFFIRQNRFQWFPKIRWATHKVNE